MQFNKRWTKVDIYYSGERNEKGKEGRERKTCQISICPFSTIPWLCGVAACCLGLAWISLTHRLLCILQNEAVIALTVAVDGRFDHIFVLFIYFPYFLFFFFPFLIWWFIHSLKDIIWWRHWFLNNYQMKGLWLWPYQSLTQFPLWPFVLFCMGLFFFF